MTQACSRRYSRGVFLNLSNHPSAGWSPLQLAEAEALGGGVVDEPFPDVAPEASTAEIGEIGADLVARIAARSPRAAMVQGEFTLAFYLVSELESRGIACYAATTRRVTETRTLPGGAAEKTSRFEFVQFRRYPVATLH
jgi:hypothetical protein